MINRSSPGGPDEGAGRDEVKCVPGRGNGMCKGKEDTLPVAPALTSLGTLF